MNGIGKALAPIQVVARRAKAGDLVATASGTVWEVEEVANDPADWRRRLLYVVDLTGHYPNCFRPEDVATLSATSAKANREALA